MKVICRAIELFVMNLYVIFFGVFNLLKLVFRGDFNFNIFGFGIYLVFRRVVFFHDFFEWLMYRYSWLHKNYVSIVIRNVFLFFLIFLSYKYFFDIYETIAYLSIEPGFLILILLLFIIGVFWVSLLFRYLLIESWLFYLAFIITIFGVLCGYIPEDEEFYFPYLTVGFTEFGTIFSNIFYLPSGYNWYNEFPFFMVGQKPNDSTFVLEFRIIFVLFFLELLLLSILFLFYLRRLKKPGFKVVKPIPYLNIGLGEVLNSDVLIFVKHVNWLVRNKPWKVEYYIHLLNEEVSLVVDDVEEDNYLNLSAKYHDLDPLMDEYRFGLMFVDVGYSNEEEEIGEDRNPDVDSDEVVPVNDLFPNDLSLYNDNAEKFEEYEDAPVASWYPARYDYLLEWDEQNEELMLRYFYWRYKWLLVVKYFLCDDKVSLLGTYYKNYFNIFNNVDLMVLNDEFCLTYKKEYKKFANQFSFSDSWPQYLSGLELVLDEAYDYFKEPPEPLYFKSGTSNFGDVLCDSYIESKVERDLFFPADEDLIVWKNLLDYNNSGFIIRKSYYENTLYMRYDDRKEVLNIDDIEFYGIVKIGGQNYDNVVKFGDKNTVVIEDQDYNQDKVDSEDSEDIFGDVERAVYRIPSYGDEVDPILDYYFDVYIYNALNKYTSQLNIEITMLNNSWFDLATTSAFLWYDICMKQLVLYFSFAGSAGVTTFGEMDMLNQNDSEVFSIVDFYTNPQLYRNINMFMDYAQELKMDYAWAKMDKILSLNHVDANEGEFTELLEDFIKKRHIYMPFIRYYLYRRHFIYGRRIAEARKLDRRLQEASLTISWPSYEPMEELYSLVKSSDLGFFKYYSTEDLETTLDKQDNLVFHIYCMYLDFEQDRREALEELHMNYEYDFADYFDNLQTKWLDGYYCDGPISLQSSNVSLSEAVNDDGVFAISTFIPMSIQGGLMHKYFSLASFRADSFSRCLELSTLWDMTGNYSRFFDLDVVIEEDDKGEYEVLVMNNFFFNEVKESQFYVYELNWLNFNLFDYCGVNLVEQVLLSKLVLNNSNNFGFDIRYILPYFDMRVLFDVEDFRAWSMIGAWYKVELWLYRFQFQVDEQANKRIEANEEFLDPFVGRAVLKYDEIMTSFVNLMRFSIQYRLVVAESFPIYSFGRGLLNNYSYNMEDYISELFNNYDSMVITVLEDV